MTKHRKPGHTIEVRSAVEEVRVAGDGKTIEGYAVVFGKPSCDMGFIEYIAPNCFRDSIAANDVRLLREHDAKLLLARTSSKTLTLSEDSHGLKFHATLPNSPIGADTAELLTRGDLSGMSFGFNPIQQAWSKEGNKAKRTITRASLAEVSIVSNPAYESSTVNLRSCPDELRSLLTRDLDDDADCDCDCSECLGGNCADCSNADCDDSNCIGCPEQSEARALTPEPEDVARYMRLQLALRS
ncbi:HK97 family phage prohead protease [Acidipila sp. EB88]|uniref:HK97 family phage prohead protease n=1 Tax=Acidipila sp. EB88 TaxID=2305226 RepID=UPI000F5FC04E|nr:HK97 family phage prohead protease [Acidipila sp. EB88]RRA48996.1 HK97 family phage prohead protease [Acidipila sp. EB88]